MLGLVFNNTQRNSRKRSLEMRLLPHDQCLGGPFGAHDANGDVFIFVLVLLFRSNRLNPLLHASVVAGAVKEKKTL